MKRILISGAAALLCGILMCSGILWCLVTAFSLPVSSVRSLMAPCMLFPLLFTFLYTWKRGGWAVLLVFAGTALWCWLKREIVLDSILAVVVPVWESYAEAYDIPLLAYFSETGNTGIALSLLTMLLAETTVRTISRRETMWGTLIFSHLFLILCLIPVFTPPAWWAFLLVVGCDALLILTERHRCMESPDSERLVLLAAVPLLLFMALVCLLRSPAKPNEGDWTASISDFVNKWEDRLIHPSEIPGAADSDWESKLPEDMDELVPDPDTKRPDTIGRYEWDSSLSYTDLTQLDDRNLSKASAMTVTADRSGYLYLRGACFSVYENNTWTMLPENAYESITLPADILLGSGANAGHSVTIETDDPCSVIYTPYYPLEMPAGSVAFYDSWLQNAGNLSRYTIRYSSSATMGAGSGRAWRNYADFVEDTCLQLPENTLTAMQPVIEEIYAQAGSDAATAQLVQAVHDYVSSCAVYSLEVDRVPSGEDFAAWFLTEADRGYCVHFATSAAVLLRACGIPSRYVVGFLAETTAGGSVSVTVAQAHAWIEYYDKDLGWLPLEVTPANGVEATAEGRKPKAPEPEEAGPEEPDEQGSSVVPDDPKEPETPEQVKPEFETPDNPSGPETADPGSRTENDPPNGTEGPEKPVVTDPQVPEKPEGLITTPGEPDEGDDAPEKETETPSGSGRDPVSPLTIALFLALMIPVLWNAALRLIRQRLFAKGSAAGRLLARYRWIEVYCRLGKLAVPGEAASLAMQVRFSNHRFTETELGRMRELYDDARKDLTETSGILKRITLFLLLAI